MIDILRAGTRRAREQASKTLEEVQEKMGLATWLLASEMTERTSIPSTGRSFASGLPPETLLYVP